MSDDHGRNELDPEIVKAVLGKIDDGSKPSVEGLSGSFPGREAEIKAAIKAVASYRKRVRSARSARVTEPGDNILAPGTILGDFTIGEMLGRGAMGVVYRARQKSLAGREVALKVLSTALVARDPRFVDRFRREAALAADVHHPNVAEVYGSGPQEDLLYFAMRLVEGRTLHDVQSALALQRRLGDTRHLRPPHVRRVARVARDIASALAAIHARGLVHRDVKPANIILEHAGDDDHEALAGRPVLVDFGLIRPVGQSDLTGTKTLLGTPAYASPETQVGREVDARADVFSLGAILHDLLTLTLPGERNLASAGLSGVRVLNPAVDRRLAAIVDMALEERTALRYADGAAFREDLDRYLQNETVRARPTTPLGQARLWARRNPIRATRISLAAAALLGLLVAAVWLGGRVTSLYNAKSSTMRSWREGALLEAADNAKPLLEDDWLHGVLPGMNAAVKQVRRYWHKDGMLSRACALLALESTAETRNAHRILHELIFDPDDNEFCDPILWFLVREIKPGGAGAAPLKRSKQLKRRLAVETASHYLLINAQAYCKERDPATWAGALETALLEILRCEPTQAEDVQLCEAAVAGLSGLPGDRVFKVLLGLCEESHGEIRRLAVEAMRRVWFQTWKAGRLAEVPPVLLGQWMKLTCVRLASAFPADFDYIAAGLTCVELEDAGKVRPRPGRFTNDILRIENAIRTCRRDRPDKLEIQLASRQNKAPLDIAAYLDGLKGRFQYTNIWEKLEEPKTGEWSTRAPGSQASDALFDFVHLEKASDPETFASPLRPRLLGAARRASCIAAELDTEGSRTENRADPAVGHYLKLTRTGVSRLDIECAVPAGAEQARVSLQYCRATRGVLPGSGRTRILIMVLENHRAHDETVAADGDAVQMVEHEILQHSQDVLEIALDPWILKDRKTLRLSLRLVDSTTTFRVYHVHVHFGSKVPATRYDGLFVPETEFLRVPIFETLLGRIVKGTSAASRLSAADTIAHYLLLYPQPYRKIRHVGQWDGNLAGVLCHVARNFTPDDFSLPVRRAAVSALGGLPSDRVFEQLIPLIKEPDLELRRLAVVASRRIWWAIQKGGKPGEFSGQIPGQWVASVCEAVSRYGENATGSAPFLHHATLALLDAARSRGLLRTTGSWPELPPQASEVLAELEAQIRTARQGGEPSAPAWPVSWPRIAVDVAGYLGSVKDEFPEFHRAGIWNSLAERGGSRCINEKLDPAAMAASFDFVRPEPELRGAAIQASWHRAVHFDGLLCRDQVSTRASVSVCDLRGKRAGHSLLLASTGSARLELECAVPDQARSARVTIEHCSQSTWRFPRAYWIANGAELCERAAFVALVLVALCYRPSENMAKRPRRVRETLAGIWMAMILILLSSLCMSLSHLIDGNVNVLGIMMHPITFVKMIYVVVTNRLDATQKASAPPAPPAPAGSPGSSG